MNIYECLAGLPGNPLLIVSPSGELSRNAVLSYAAETRQAMSGLRLGVHVADLGIALPILAALDGMAEVITLFSPVASPELVARLASGCNLDAIICDVPDLFTAVAGVPPAYSDLKTLAVSISSRECPLKTRWILTTSGTTGEAKLVSHSLMSLTRTTKIDPTIGAYLCWGMLYDYTRFAGLQVLLQATLSGSKLIAPSLNDALDRKIAAFADNNCTHLSATPTLWRKILMTPGAEKLAPLQVTLGGEIVDDRILTAIAGFFPCARVTHIFASTEAGVGFSVTDKRAGFPVSYLTDPPKSIAIKIDENKLYVRNMQVCPQYFNSEVYFATNDGWIDTGDVIEIKGDRVMFQGRASGVINVGGDKVHPEEVERVLLSHPLVAAARVYSKANPITGALVAADIVLTDLNLELSETRKVLSAHVERELGRTKVPVIIKFVSALQISAAGKLMRS